MIKSSSVLLTVITALVFSACVTVESRGDSERTLERPNAHQASQQERQRWGKQRRDRRRESPPAASSTARAGLLIIDHFEDQTSLAQWGSQTGSSTNIVISDEVSRSGSHSVKFTVNINDEWIAGGPRSELHNSRELGRWNDGDEIWLAASFYFPAESAQDPLREIIWQLHGGKDAGVPFLIRSVGENLEFIGKGIGNFTIPKRLGGWMDIVTHHKWSSHGDGLTEVYVDGRQYISADNIVNKDEHPVYWKFGLYKSGWKKGVGSAEPVPVKSVYVDDVCVGGSGLTLDDIQRSCRQVSDH